MKRAAFSLIELIFVIIILGILSAVVSVKMSGMTDQARVSKLKSFVGTLNRSVGPAIWFNSLNDSRNGSVKFADYESNIENYTQIIPDYTGSLSLTNCNDAGNGIFLSYEYSKSYEIHCKDGISTTSPKFRLYNSTDALYIED